MSDDVYGLDPVLLANGRLSTRDAPDPAVEIGLGSPHHFTVKADQPLGDEWSAGTTPPGWTLRTIDGSVVFDINQTQATDARQSLKIARPFDLNTVVTMSFWVNLDFDIPDDDPGTYTITIECGAGVTLLVNNHAQARWVNALAAGAKVGESTIVGDSVPRHVLLIYNQTGVKIYEDGSLVGTVAHYPGNAGATLDGQALGNAVAATFFVGMHGADIAATVGIADVTVVAGAPVPVTTDTLPAWASAWESTFAKLETFAAELQHDTAALVAALQDIAADVRPWHLFTGYDAGAPVQSAAVQFMQSQAATDFVETARAGQLDPEARGKTLFVGIGATGSYWVSGGVEIGILFDFNRIPTAMALVLTIGGGAGYAKGLSVHADVGFTPLSIDQMLGYGGAVQGDMGEFAQVGIGVSGNLPLSLAEPVNCGPTLLLGLAVGQSYEVAGYVTYTWQMAHWHA